MGELKTRFDPELQGKMVITLNYQNKEAEIAMEKEEILILSDEIEFIVGVIVALLCSLDEALKYTGCFPSGGNAIN